MDDRSSAGADTLELLHINPIAIRAAIEEVSLWIMQRGSIDVHHNVLSILQTLDTNAGAIAAGIASIRSRPE